MYVFIKTCLPSHMAQGGFCCSPRHHLTSPTILHIIYIYNYLFMPLFMNIIYIMCVCKHTCICFVFYGFIYLLHFYPAGVQSVLEHCFLLQVKRGRRERRKICFVFCYCSLLPLSLLRNSLASDGQCRNIEAGCATGGSGRLSPLLSISS